MDSLRIIYDQQYADLRIIHRRHGNNGRIRGIGISAGIRFVGCTGLTADFISIDFKSSATAIINNILHDILHFICSLF